MEITAQKREIFGKKTKSLRKNRQIPGVMFGKGIDSIPLTVDYNQFLNVFREAGETALIDLKVDGAKEKVNEKVLVKDVQFHPVTEEILSVGFYKVDLTEKITAEIPVDVVGEEANVLIKSGQAIAITILSDITVESLPADLPQTFVVNVSRLQEIGDGVTVGELDYDREKVEVVGVDNDELVVKLDYAEMAEEEEEEVVSEEELIEGLEATEETAESDAEEVGVEGSAESGVKE